MTTVTPSRSSQHLALLDLDDGRHLSNTSDHGVRRLVYSTWALYPDMVREGEIVVTSRPYYELTDLPARSHVFLEAHDPYEDGIVLYRLEEVVWDDGAEERRVILSRERGAISGFRGRGSRLNPESLHRALTRIEGEKRKLRTDPGGVISEAEENGAGDYPTLFSSGTSEGEPSGEVKG